MHKINNNKFKRILIYILIIIAVMVGGFLLYASDYYRADDIALTVMNTGDNIEVKGNLTILKPAAPSDTALIFYPGAKVEHTAYLPILNKLRQNGITCVLVKMPFNMAIFDVNAADEVFDKLPDIQHWYIGGHSMGGAMASSYASKHSDKVDGLILMGAYVYGDYPPSKALTIYGTFNSSLEKKIDYTDNIVIIDGGNHAQFGNYGKQKGDPDASITAEEQQAQTVEAIMKFIENNKNN